MREWSLGSGDPLALTLAADFRLCTPDYANDHTWELEMGGGDPPALALRTTYGLRARSMRIFPRFSRARLEAVDPAAFPIAPRLRRFYPNFLLLDFSPFAGLEATAEYWVPGSQVLAGRLSLANRTAEPLSLRLELCAQLVPLDGQSLAPVAMQSVQVLAGRSVDLAPVLFLTGGPQPGPGAHASLALDVHLSPGMARQFTWVQAALAEAEASFELARRTAARPWDAERARLELVNAAQTVEIQTGDPDWDAALALSQKTAFSLFLGPGLSLPQPSFVQARGPDTGFSPHGDGSDYSHLWNGQSPLEAYYLASLLPGAPGLAQGLLRNFLATQAGDGTVDNRPGLAGQHGRWLAAPFLASLAWLASRSGADPDFLTQVFPGLNAFYQRWFAPDHDRDGDGFPEWDHPLQTGFEDNPAFSLWPAGGQGADIRAAESPALAAALCREGTRLARMAPLAGAPELRQDFELRAAALRGLVEECWSAEAAFYHVRDRESHLSPKGKSLAKQRGPGKAALELSFQRPTRLLVRLLFKREATLRPEIVLRGRGADGPQTERLSRADFQWASATAVATTRGLFTTVSGLTAAGLGARDQVQLQVMDFSAEDVTLFLPLWAEIPPAPRAAALVNRTLFAADRFGLPFGAPACPGSADPLTQAVLLPWNQLIGEGLLAYGLRQDAARLTVRLMTAVIEHLKRQRAFAQFYHAETGSGLGERNALTGLAPLGLFLQALGVQIQSPSRVLLSGKNPFPWIVTVKYRGLTVTRQAEQTQVVFADGRSLTLNDPTEAVVSFDA